MTSSHGVFTETYTAVRATLAVDDSLQLWADAAPVVTHTGWYNPVTIEIPYTTEIVAVEALNIGGYAGMLMSFNYGPVSGASWRCTDVAPESDCMSIAFKARNQAIQPMDNWPTNL